MGAIFDDVDFVSVLKDYLLWKYLVMLEILSTVVID